MASKHESMHAIATDYLYSRRQEENGNDGRAAADTTLRRLSDIRRYFLRSQRPLFFFGPTNFNLIGMENWCQNFHHVAYFDCFDGQDKNVFVPDRRAHEEFDSIESINNYLLTLADVRDYVNSFGESPAAIFLMFDERTERLAREAGLDVWFPAAKLRRHIDNKINTVRIGNEAGVHSVPNVLHNVRSYDHLRKVAKGLGPDLVLQSAYGDSGHTTYFISDRADFNRYAREIVGAGELKIMKRISCRSAAVEACATKHGTIVGPLMTELVGFPELTPYGGGWCGNELFPGAFNEDIRRKAGDMTVKLGEQLTRRGYRGYFEVDFLVDDATGDLYLGELNPRIAGTSSLTNHACFAYADAPLFLFHLLEFADIGFELDIDGLNRRWADPDYIDTWGQLVIKHTGPDLGLIGTAPRSGIWRLGQGNTLAFDHFDVRRHAVAQEDQGFFLRVSNVGDWAYRGADLGILITRGRLMTDSFELNARAHRWIAGIREQFATVLETGRAFPMLAGARPSSGKML